MTNTKQTPTGPYPTPLWTKLTTERVRLHMEVITPDRIAWTLWATLADGTRKWLAVLDEDQAEQWLAALGRIREVKA